MFRVGFLACCLFFFWIPKEKENRLAVEKEGVGTVIDLLATEIPEVEAHRAFEVLKVN
jgi:hypothetical protein